MPKVIYTDDVPVKLYEMILDGRTQDEVCRSLGISKETLKDWRRNRTPVREAVERARARVQQGRNPAPPPPVEKFDLAAYTYRRLPPDVRVVWDEMEAIEHEPNAEKRLEAVLADAGENLKKYLFVHALTSSNFNKAEACRRVMVHVTEPERWAKEDPRFGQLLTVIEEVKNDWIEGCLLNLVAGGDSAATIFAARTKLRGRGYDPRVTVQHEGKILHGHVDLDRLNLDLDTRRRILQSLRAGQLDALEAHSDEGQ